MEREKKDEPNTTKQTNKKSSGTEMHTYSIITSSHSMEWETVSGQFGHIQSITSLCHDCKEGAWSLTQKSKIFFLAANVNILKSLQETHRKPNGNGAKFDLPQIERKKNQKNKAHCMPYYCY